LSQSVQVQQYLVNSHGIPGCHPFVQIERVPMELSTVTSVLHREMGLVYKAVNNMYDACRFGLELRSLLLRNTLRSWMWSGIRYGVLTAAVVGVLSGLYIAGRMYINGNTMREVWIYVAQTDRGIIPDADTGDGGEFRVEIGQDGLQVRVRNDLVRDPINMYDPVAMELLQNTYDAVGTTHITEHGFQQMQNVFNGPVRIGWREQLLNFFERMGMPRFFVNKYRAKITAARSVRRAGTALLHYREQIFLVRSVVHSRLGRESLIVENDATRLIVSRTVNEVMTNLKLNLRVCDMIREACINVCFIDTMYDEAGKELKLGPRHRPA